MRLHRRIGLVTVVASALAGSTTLAGPPASAGPVPKASISIQPATGPLKVQFVAQSGGFASSVTAYAWSFGDGQSAQTAQPRTTHRYRAPGTYGQPGTGSSLSVTETDSTGQKASASGILELTPCPVGASRCMASLQAPPSQVSINQASGPISSSSPAEINLFSGSYRFPNCDPVITPAGSLTDSGFTGPLTVTYSYNTTNPDRVNRTCFASTGFSGPLSSCQTNPTPPCVASMSVNGTLVTKTIIIPAGDPKFGS